MGKYIREFFAEFIGTFTLVLFGTGVAALIGDPLMTALAFGLSIIACAYTIGKISGCHVNPAVSLAMLIDGRIKIVDFLCYIVAQVAGAFAGSGVLYFVIKQTTLTTVNLAANGFGDNSVALFTLSGALVLEMILTFVFVYAVLGVTKDESKSSVAPVTIGLTLALVHLLGFYLTGTSVNPARSLAPAVIMGGTYLSQVWVFIVAPFVGAALAAVVFKLLNTEPKAKVNKAKKSK